MRLTSYSTWVGLISFISFVGLAIYQLCTYNINEIAFVISEIVLAVLFFMCGIITYLGDK